jgi:uncharacterized protein YeaO (DUF488 family)
MPVVTKRVYEPYAKLDGYRVLVDRLWPRGIKKEAIHVDLWLKEVAPSTALRKWIHADKARWPEFVKKYKEELKKNESLGQLKDLLKQHKKITLLYGAKDEAQNHAQVLLQLIGKHR